MWDSLSRPACASNLSARGNTFAKTHEEASMKDTFRLKTWAGPLTIGSFVVIAGTGILMFFHLNVGVVKLAHE